LRILEVALETTHTPVVAAHDSVGLALPVQILTPGDISRLSRETEDIENFFAQAAVKGATTKTVPQSSQQLTALINDNSLNILHKEDRVRLHTFLESVRAQAPIVHVSFATDPKPDFLMKLVVWFRSNAHPYVLLQVGLQPNIAAGCVLRTRNKYFDLSFKQHFQESKAKLAAALRTDT
jgi:F0F1-type ATP synthase delta subunit